MLAASLVRNGRVVADHGVQIAGMKGLLNRKFGYSSLPRRPLLPMSGSLVDELLKNEYIVALLEEEKRLTHGSS